MSASRRSTRWTSSSSTRARSTPAMPAGAPAAEPLAAQHRVAALRRADDARAPPHGVPGARRADAESHPRARDHRAQPRRNERIPVKTRILAAALLAPALALAQAAGEEGGKAPAAKPAAAKPDQARRHRERRAGPAVARRLPDAAAAEPRRHRHRADARHGARRAREPRDPDAGGAKDRHRQAAGGADPARHGAPGDHRQRLPARLGAQAPDHRRRGAAGIRQGQGSSTATRNTRRATSWWRPRTRRRR